MATILLTRPQAQSEALAERLSALGWTCLIAPLLRYEPLPPPPGFDALLSGAGALAFTSANGVRAFAAASARRDLPVHAVGDATAEAARDAGFAKIDSASGDAAALARRILAAQPRGPVLHVRGEEARGDLVAGLRAEGLAADEAVLYAMRAAQALPQPAVRALASGEAEAAAFYSPRTARVFADLARLAGLAPLSSLRAAAISAAAAEPLSGLGLAATTVAETPDSESMLRAIGRPRG